MYGSLGCVQVGGRDQTAELLEFGYRESISFGLCVSPGYLAGVAQKVGVLMGGDVNDSFDG